MIPFFVGKNLKKKEKRKRKKKNFQRLTVNMKQDLVEQKLQLKPSCIAVMQWFSCRISTFEVKDLLRGLFRAS